HAPRKSTRVGSARLEVLAKHCGGGFFKLVERDFPQGLCEAPAGAEGVGDLTVALAPESVLERLPDMRAGIDRAVPQRVDVIRIQVQNGGGAADAERRQDAPLRELVRQHDG